MRLPRFRVRTLMVAVALAAAAWAAIAAIIDLGNEARKRWDVAESHRLREADALGSAVRVRSDAMGHGPHIVPADLKERVRRADQLARHHRRRAEFHAAMRLKYERAARYPFLSVIPDPLEPDAPPPE